MSEDCAQRVRVLNNGIPSLEIWISSHKAFVFVVAIIVTSTILLFNTALAQGQYPVIYEVDKKIATHVDVGTFQIRVTFDIQPGWYIYAPTGTNEALGMVESNVVFTVLPQGMGRLGDVRVPEVVYKNAHEVYEGNDVTMVQTFNVDKSLIPGEYLIKGKVTYQSCSEDRCFPPVTESFTVEVEVKE
jgi:hypothetical protein